MAFEGWQNLPVRAATLGTLGGSYPALCLEADRGVAKEGPGSGDRGSDDTSAMSLGEAGLGGPGTSSLKPLLSLGSIEPRRPSLAGAACALKLEALLRV